MTRLETGLSKVLRFPDRGASRNIRSDIGERESCESAVVEGCCFTYPRWLLRDYFIVGAMKYDLVLIVTMASWTFTPAVRGCAATGGGGGTTPTGDPCPPGDNTAGLTTLDVTAQDAGDTASPTQRSPSCTAGERQYWPGASTAQPDDAEANAQKALGVQCPTASNLCICSCTGVCCQPGATAPDTVSFIPFCTGGTCSMYAVLEGDDAASLSCSDGSTFTVANQRDGNGDALPVTSGSYFSAGSVSCDGCSGIQSSTCDANLVSA